MLLFWTVLIGFAIAETCVVFWLPIFADSPPIWSRPRGEARKSAVLSHGVFLAVCLGVVGFLTWSERSFNWLSLGISPSRVFRLLLSAVVMGSIERLVFYRISKDAHVARS